MDARDTDAGTGQEAEDTGLPPKTPWTIAVWRLLVLQLLSIFLLPMRLLIAWAQGPRQKSELRRALEAAARVHDLDPTEDPGHVEHHPHSS